MYFIDPAEDGVFRNGGIKALGWKETGQQRKGLKKKIPHSV